MCSAAGTKTSTASILEASMSINTNDELVGVCFRCCSEASTMMASYSPVALLVAPSGSSVFTAWHLLTIFNEHINGNHNLPSACFSLSSVALSQPANYSAAFFLNPHRDLSVALKPTSENEETWKQLCGNPHHVFFVPPKPWKLIRRGEQALCGAEIFEKENLNVSSSESSTRICPSGYTISVLWVKNRNRYVDFHTTVFTFSTVWCGF